MPKKPLMRTAIYNYVLDYFKDRYEDSQSFRIRRGKPEDRKFPTVESIVDFVLENEQLVESNTETEPELGQTRISRGTIRNAVNELIEQHKITLTGKSYEFVPHMEKSLEHHPILDIADKINISIGVPDEMIVLSVRPEHAISITNYLSALFYKGDIIFIPIAGNILCISVFPENRLNVATKPNSEGSNRIKLRERIEMAIHKFNYYYPQFAYGLHYELAYHASHNPVVIEELTEEAKSIEKRSALGDKKNVFKNLQEATYWAVEHADDISPSGIHPESGLTEEEDRELTEELKDYLTDMQKQEEFDLMDSSIMDIVDDEFND